MSVPGFSSVFSKKSVTKIACQYNDSRAEIFGNEAMDSNAGKNSGVLQN